MILSSLVVLSVICAIITVISFVLYVRARMAEEEKKEQLYKSVHFTSLFIFVIAGVLILIILSNQPAA